MFAHTEAFYAISRALAQSKIRLSSNDLTPERSQALLERLGLRDVTAEQLRLFLNCVTDVLAGTVDRMAIRVVCNAHFDGHVFEHHGFRAHVPFDTSGVRWIEALEPDELPGAGQKAALQSSGVS